MEGRKINDYTLNGSKHVLLHCFF